MDTRWDSYFEFHCAAVERWLSGVLGECYPGYTYMGLKEKFWLLFSQIIAPHDSGISDAIHFHLKPVSFVSQMQNSELFFDVTKELHKKYFDYLISFCPPR